MPARAVRSGMSITASRSGRRCIRSRGHRAALTDDGEQLQPVEAQVVADSSITSGARGGAQWAGGVQVLHRATAGGILAAALLMLLPGRDALGQTTRVVETQPPANGIIGQRPAQYFIRFAGPVDHYRA